MTQKALADAHSETAGPEKESFREDRIAGDFRKGIPRQRYMIETAQKMGVAVRVELNRPRNFEPYRDLGIKHVGVDVK